MTQRVPKRKLGHMPWRQAFVQNSPHGNDIFASEGCGWCDNDWLLASDRTWINRHGWPETVWGPLKTITKPWEYWSKLRHTYRGRVYQIRNFKMAIADARKRNQGMEAEIKNLGLDPKDEGQRAIILEALERMVAHAKDAWGEAHWRAHLNLKMVSTIGPGLNAYVLPMMQLGDSLEIPTLVTVRGKDRFRRTPWPAYVTYVRGQVTPVR